MVKSNSMIIGNLIKAGMEARLNGKEESGVCKLEVLNFSGLFKFQNKNILKPVLCFLLTSFLFVS